MMVRMQVQFSELEKRGQAPHLSAVDRAGGSDRCGACPRLPRSQR